jgi:hypothetical protein
MTTAYTTLLGLAQPVTGELSGTWGATVNDYITTYLDSAVAGAQTISGTQTAVTLSVTNGSSLVSAGAAATGSAQYSIINCTGTPASLLTITAPAASKTYIVINATAQSVKLVGAGPTAGVTMVTGEKAVCSWNGTDFVKVASSVISSFTGTLPVANGGTGLTSGTSGGVLAYTASGTLASSALLTQYGVVYGGGAGAVPVATANGTTGQAFVATTSSAPSWGVVGAVGGGTGVANNAAMTVTGSGNFAYTRTLTGTTNVTFPTTGTLATLAGTETFTNKTLTNPTITAYLETAPAIVNSSTAQTIALAGGTVLSYTLTGNCTFTMPTATSGTSFIMRLIQDATGSRTAVFTGVKWPAGTAPTITTTASTGVDIISFVCIASVWYGNAAQAFA